MITAIDKKGKTVKLDKKDFAPVFPEVMERLEGICNGKSWKMSDLARINIIHCQEPESNQILESISDSIFAKTRFRANLLPNKIFKEEGDPQQSCPAYFAYLKVVSDFIGRTSIFAVIDGIDKYLTEPAILSDAIKMVSANMPNAQIFITQFSHHEYDDENIRVFSFDEILGN